MSYAILRTEKLKTIGNIAASLSHNYRNRPTPNADPYRTVNNEHDLKTAGQVMDGIKNRLPEKTRSNAVLCVEYLITMSPDWSGLGTEKEADFFKRSVEWLKQRHGAENVISTSIHRDETTPHLVAYVVPIDLEGKLNAREFLGGRAKLSKMQTDFHDQVKDLGLERGLEGSKAEHTTIKDFYAEIQKPNDKKYLIQKPPLKTVTYNESTIHALDGKSLKDEKIQKYFGSLFDEQHEYYQKQSLKAQEALSVKLSEQIIKTEKEAEAHRNAVKQIKKLEKKIDKMLDEFSQIIEFKELFPNDYKEIEQSLKDRIQDHKNQLIRKREEDARFEAQLRAHRQQLAKEQERQQAIEFRNTLESDRKMQIEADRAYLRSKVGECTTEPEKLAYNAIQSKLEGVISEGANYTALLDNNEPTTNPYAEILRLMNDREVYDFKKKLEIILNQCADSKSKDYDDTFRSWGTRPSYYDNFDSSAKYIVAIQSIIDDQVQEGGVLAYEKANEVKRALSDVLVGKCKNEYDVLLSDEQTKERQRKYDEKVEQSNKNQIDKGVHFEQEKKKGNDFEM
ncbi:plasmid recombination protein [Acinetobacter baumannii]|nr:plasmid recombination protein [Acinetobacter baumannii]EHU1827231.1 plasmid recombination protein [Acinetobacter baumannii]EHU1892555.1 plasmid recombination protein [Acinetobacter baumannii]EHU1953900.1 plasmid recombination protein [Acinetobacter baumannii]HCG3326310.1 plasmid recombination protein [Acinetobacter baumannii]